MKEIPSKARVCTFNLKTLKCYDFELSMKPPLAPPLSSFKTPNNRRVNSCAKCCSTKFSSRSIFSVAKKMNAASCKAISKSFLNLLLFLYPFHPLFKGQLDTEASGNKQFVARLRPKENILDLQIFKTRKFVVFRPTLI